MDQDWMKNPALAGIDPAKIALLRESCVSRSRKITKRNAEFSYGGC